MWIKILLIKLTNSSKHSLMLAKTGIEVHLMHEFMPPKPFLVLLQQTCPIHYFSLKLMFWVVPCHFVATLDMLQKQVSRHI